MATKTLTTPAGLARFPSLNRPDTKFSEVGVYKVNLELSAEDAELHIAKHRAGATAKVNLVWRPRLTRFENAALGNRLTDGDVFAPSPKLWEAINE